MSARPAKRRSSAKDAALMLSTPSVREEEKTIPFLRRLCDMLEENVNAISFYPGCRKNGSTVLGRIVVHDRAKVESEVLPKYFNHASFASLRRQLNYFSFTRIGKGRQRGATYCNEAVVEIHDILRLKRRAVGSSSIVSVSQESLNRIETKSESSSSLQGSMEHNHDESNGDSDGLPSSLFSVNNIRSSGAFNSVVPVVHLPANNGKGPRSLRRKLKHHSRSMPKLISPVSTSPVPDDNQEPRVTLDLTIPSGSMTYSYGNESESYSHHHNVEGHTTTDRSSDAFAHNDDDILEGCNALLSFSSGVRPPVGLA